MKVARNETLEAEVELEEAVERSPEKKSDEQYLMTNLNMISTAGKTIPNLKQVTASGLK